MFIKLEATERGVIFRQFTTGLDKENVYEPGFHVIAPWNDMYVFNVVFPRYREDSPNAAALCESMDLNFVPLLGIYTLPPTVDEVLKMAHGKSRLADINREGLVIRSLDGRDSFKAVDPLFLLEHDE